MGSRGKGGHRLSHLTSLTTRGKTETDPLSLASPSSFTDDVPTPTPPPPGTPDPFTCVTSPGTIVLGMQKESPPSDVPPPLPLTSPPPPPSTYQGIRLRSLRRRTRGEIPERFTTLEGEPVRKKKVRGMTGGLRGEKFSL